MNTKIYFILLLTLFVTLANVNQVSAQDDESVVPEVEDITTETPRQEIIDGFSQEDRELLDSSSEKHQFDADVSRLMDIIINSLYTHKEVFIRELVSNASDACDKVRFLAIQNPDYLGEQKDLEVRIEYDADQKTFTIEDSGIGMTKKDLIKNLGTIAKTGTTSFIEAISKGSSLNLIGQFGVGFYSAYLVSNKVVVTTKNNEDDQHVWISTAGASYTVSKDPRGNTIGRGSRITLHLKEDAYEFYEQEVIKKNIKKYSEFINFPIYLRVNKTYTREEEIPEPETEAEEEPEKKEESEDLEEKKEEDAENTEEKTEEKKEEEKKPKTRSIQEWKWDWELVNENKPIWIREKKEITNDEYIKFYKAITKDQEDPYSWDHGQTEGEAQYKYLIYFPAKRPYDMFENYYGKNSALKLYVRRVLVNEQFEELMPRYLNFIKGVVDSDDLPLNVSREQLQQDKMVKMMSKKLVRTAIHKMLKLAAAEVEDDDDEDEEDDDEAEDEKEEEDKKTDNKFLTFYENFGKNIKLGVIEDTANRSRLAKLLRFYSLKNAKDLISLDDYIGEMKEKQEDIYYFAGEEKDHMLASPLIQKFKEKDINVLLLDDPIDEFCAQNLGEYEKKKLKNIAKGDIKFGDEDDLSKKKEKKIKEAFKVLVDWWKKLLGAKVETIKISKRLSDTACIITTSEYGYTANMARIQKAQAFTNQNKQDSSYMYGKKTLEINPNHPSIKDLREKVLKFEIPPNEVEDTATLLYDTALLTSGFQIEDPNEFSERMDRVLKYNLNIDRFEKSTEFEVDMSEDDEAKETATEEEANLDEEVNMEDLSVKSEEEKADL
jgi:heat shock protein beta